MKGIQNTSNKTFRQLMGNGLRYEIPKYQRDYTWETEQWDDLWQDIIKLYSGEEAGHYLGYLVLKTSNDKEFFIIDGQQRLTTLSILILTILKCLQELADKNIDADNNLKRKEQLQNSYIGYIDPVTLISKNKLILNRNSNTYYKEYLVLLKDFPPSKINSSEKQMRDCFKWYFENLKKKFNSGEELTRFIDDIVDKLFFTVIEVSDEINASNVFETLNARGVQLSSADLLKNHLFSIVDKTNPHENEINVLEELWKSITDKLGEQKFEEYLRYFWNSENKTVSKKSMFKVIKSKILEKKDVFDLVRKLRDSADLFNAIQKPDAEFWKDKPIEIMESLKELKLFKIKQTYSLLISGFYYLNENDFKKLCSVCSIISFRYNTISGLNPNEQEEVYNSIALYIKENKKFLIQDFQPIYVLDSTFENNFSNKEFKNTTPNHKIVKYIFSKIERYKYKNEISIESDLFTVEHILPQSADLDWGDFKEDEIQRSIYRIGNLTLLEKKLNKDVANLNFQAKAELFKKSNSKITQSIPSNYDSWSQNKIHDRQKELAKDAKSIWRIQELESKKS